MLAEKDKSFEVPPETDFESANTRYAVLTSSQQPAASSQQRQRHTPLLVGLGLTFATLTLYIFTLAPSVMPGDYAEFQMAAAILGVPHPTGYPLYILLGKLFTLLPFGDIAYRVNLSSAVYMAGAVGMLYTIGLHLLRLLRLERWWPAAVVGAGLFAVAPTVWSMALVARSYALNALLVSLVLYSLLQWRGTGRVLWFYLSALLIGLSMVHHGTTYLLLPAYGIFLLIVEIERHKQGVDGHPWLRRILGVGALTLGYTPMLFLVYSFVWGAPYYWGNPATWRDFLSLITGGPFHNQVLAFGWDAQIERFLFGVGELSAQFTPVGIALGLLGLAVLWRARWVEGLLITLMIVGNFTFAMNYSLVGYLYFIPTYLLWGALMTIAVGWLAMQLSRVGVARNSPMRQRAVALISGLAFLLVLASLTVLRYPQIDQSGQTATRDEALALLSAAPPGASIYLDWEDVSVIRYYRMVYGTRLDTALHTGDPADWPKSIYCDLENNTPVYVGEFAGEQPPIVARDFALEPAPMGWRVTQAVNPDPYLMPPCGLCATCR
jgi:hypothetical protein